MSETEKRRKHRKMKANNEKNVMKAEEVVGYRGCETIDSILEFIESSGDKKGKPKTITATLDKNNKKNNVKKEKEKARVKLKEKGNEKKGSEEKDLYESEDQKDSGNGNSALDKKSKARSEEMKPVMGYSKNKLGEKLKRSSSLEELSQTRILDRTFQVEIKKQSTFDNVMDTGILDTISNFPPEEKNRERVGEKKRFGKKEEEQKVDDTEDACQQMEIKDTDRREDGKLGDNPLSVTGSETCTASKPVKTHSTAGMKTAEEQMSGFVADFYAFSDINSQVFEESEFHVVTKKQRKKKKRTSAFTDDAAYCRDGSYGYNARRRKFDFAKDQNETEESAVMLLAGLPLSHRQQRADRRKSTSSVPPSDNSDSSDLDSIHSLPVSSTTPKPHIKQTSTSSGSTPQASYADIAKMASAAGSKLKQPAFGNGTNKTVPTPSKNPNPGVVATNGNKTGSPQPNGPKVNAGQADNKVSTGTIEKNKMRTFTKTVVADGNPTSGLKTFSVSAQTPDYKKKDATTSTTLDNKVVVLNKCTVKEDEPQKLEVDLDKKKELNIFEDYYPSLEESLDVRKVSKTASSVSAIQVKTSGSENSCNNNGNGRTETSPDRKDTETRTPADSDCYSQNSGNQNSDTDTVVSMVTSPPGVPVLSSASEVEDERTVTTVLPPGDSKSGICSNVESVTISSSPRDMKIKTGKKTAATKNLPPVIIMDTSESSAAVSDLSDFTFGFEVNEQLLAISDTSVSDSSEQRNDTIKDLPAKIEGYAQVTSNITSVVNSERTVDHTSEVIDVLKDSDITNQSSELTDNKNQKQSDCYVATSPKSETIVAVEIRSGKDFTLMFTEPREPDTKCFNYNHIIDYIGQSWENVMKEMERSSSNPAKVQYYTGN